ncbi:hypothetical protein SDC9_189152 [bioreactor metagenome]|uniref:Uncharacterized protein n=1 Tax=bioreactor metagenome TaxID=1076179 RepID=A0A645HRC5_9ZZZZ
MTHLGVAQQAVIGLGQAVTAQGSAELECGGATDGDGFGLAVETAGADGTQLRCDQDVFRTEGGDLGVHPGLAEQVDQLAGDRECRVQLIALEQL